MGLFDTILENYNAANRTPEEIKRDAASRTASAYSDVTSSVQDMFNQEGPLQPGQEREDMVVGGDDPLVRMREELNAMIGSGDPALQTKALNLMGNYFDKSTAVANSSSAPTAVKEYQFAKTQGFEGSFQDWKAAQKTKMFESKRVGHNDQFQDKHGNRVSVPAGTTLAEVEAQGLYPYKPVSADSAGKVAMLETAQNQFDIVDKNITGGDGEFDQEIIAWNQLVNKIPITSYFVPEKAKKLNAALETGMQAITRTETGAAMAKEEIDNTKVRFMPKYGDGKAVQEQKLNAYKYFINNAIILLDPKATGNVGLTPEQIMNRAATTALNVSKNGGAREVQEGYTIGHTEDGYEYIGGSLNDKNSWREVK